jgi:hypothetical protein
MESNPVSDFSPSCKHSAHLAFISGAMYCYRTKSPLEAMSFVLKNIHADLYLPNEVIIVKVAISIFASFEGYM